MNQPPNEQPESAPTAKMRVFIALQLPPPLLDRVAAWQAQLKSQLPHPWIRWTKPSQIHLTMLFLGHLPASQLPSLQQALAAAAYSIPPFDLEPHSAGTFPSLKRPRVLWAGLRGQLDVLVKLHRRTAAAFQTLHQNRDDRPFHPHLTLARIQPHPEAATALTKLLQAHPPPAFGTWPVQEMVLVRSHLSPTGASYQNLATERFLNK